MKVKIYNTIRELSNRAVEIFALRSLGEEIFSPGPGGGYSWLQEHLGSNYIAAWFVPRLKEFEVEVLIADAKIAIEGNTARLGPVTWASPSGSRDMTLLAAKEADGVWRITGRERAD